MANKKTKKVPLEKERLLEALQLRNCSIRGLGADYSFGWSSKSIERGIKDGEASLELLDALGQHLDVDPDYLSGKYHRHLANLKVTSVIEKLKLGLNADKFPYLRKRQRDIDSGKFLYDKYLEYLLIIHDISMRQFNDLNFVTRKSLQLELEDVVASVLIKHFQHNALGQDIYPTVYKVRNEIESFDPDEPKFSDIEPTTESGVSDLLESKYSVLPFSGGASNENQK